MSRMIELAERIEAHETWLDYHLDAWESATDKGFYASADGALTKAAEHAAIVNALRARATQGEKQ